MLIEFRVANFRSFNEEQTLSMVASSGRDEKLPDNLIPCNKFNLLKSAAIYGANASGKSNLIKAFDTMKWFIENSATKLNQGDSIPEIEPFRLDKKTKQQPVTFEAIFIIDEIRYEYGFTANNERVFDEWLVAIPPSPKRRQTWFERRHRPSSKQSKWLFRGPLAKDEKILIDKTRDNCLVLSRGAELNIDVLNKIYSYFKENINIYNMSEAPYSLINETTELIKKHKRIHERVNQLISHADIGIDKIDTTEESLLMQILDKKLENKNITFDETKESTALKKLTALMMNTYKDIFKTMAEKAESIDASVLAIHKIYGTNQFERFSILEESDGTQRFFSLLGPFLNAVENGKIIIIDELECSLHPLLSRKLIELFQSQSAKKASAQLIFATHDSTLMDPELFRRDQIWIAEKNAKGATELYSLYDFDTKDRPRNTERFQRNYLAGRYGGVPKFGPTLEDLEIE